MINNEYFCFDINIHDNKRNFKIEDIEKDKELDSLYINILDTLFKFSCNGEIFLYIPTHLLYEKLISFNKGLLNNINYQLDNEIIKIDNFVVNNINIFMYNTEHKGNLYDVKNNSILHKFDKRFMEIIDKKNSKMINIIDIEITKPVNKIDFKITM